MYIDINVVKILLREFTDIKKAIMSLKIFMKQRNIIPIKKIFSSFHKCLTVEFVFLKRLYDVVRM